MESRVRDFVFSYKHGKALGLRDNGIGFKVLCSSLLWRVRLWAKISEQVLESWGLYFRNA